MAKLSNMTSAVFEFINNQTVENANGKRLHEFEIVNRFKPVIGQQQAIKILDRLAQKHHILKSTSTQRMATGRQTSYYRANPDNPYYDGGTGRKASVETLKKLEKLRNVPVDGVLSLTENEAVMEPENPPGSQIDSMSHFDGAAGNNSAGVSQTKTSELEPSNQTDVLCLVQGISEKEGKDQISLLLDLGASRTEIVDVETAYKLFLGLKSIFERT